jgi:hypothetical protein
MVDDPPDLAALSPAERTIYDRLIDPDLGSITLIMASRRLIADAFLELARRRENSFNLQRTADPRPWRAATIASPLARAAAAARDRMAVDVLTEPPDPGRDPTLADALKVARGELIDHAVAGELRDVGGAATLRSLAEAVGRLEALAATEAREPSPVEARLEDLLRRALDVIDAASALPGGYFEGERLADLRVALENLNESLAP